MSGTLGGRTYCIHSLSKEGHNGMSCIPHQHTVWFNVKGRTLHRYHGLGRQQKEILYQGLPSEENNPNITVTLNWALNSAIILSDVLTSLPVALYWETHKNARKNTGKGETEVLLVLEIPLFPLLVLFLTILITYKKNRFDCVSITWNICVLREILLSCLGRAVFQLLWCILDFSGKIEMLCIWLNHPNQTQD